MSSTGSQALTNSVIGVSGYLACLMARLTTYRAMVTLNHRP